MLIEGSRHIASKLNKNLNKVVIAKDLTPEQRRERREKEKGSQNGHQSNLVHEGVSNPNNAEKCNISKNVHADINENTGLENEVQNPYSDETMRSPDRTVNNSDKIVMISKTLLYTKSNSQIMNIDKTEASDKGSAQADVTVIGGVPSQPVHKEKPRAQPGRN